MGNGGLCYGNARIKPRILALEGGCEEGPAITIPTILRGPSQAASSYRFSSLKDLFSLFLKFTTPDSVIWVKKNVLLKKPPNTENNGFSAIYFTSKGSFED